VLYKLTLITYFLGRLLQLPSHPNKAGLNDRPSVRAQKKLTSFNEFWCLDRVIHNGMPYDPIHGQGHWGPKKFRKWPISKSVSYASMHVIKKLTVNYDTPRQYLNFNWTDLWYSSSRDLQS